MKKNINLLLALVSLLIIIGCVSTPNHSSNRPPLILTITPDKDIYRVGEIVSVTLKLTNISKTSLLVYGRMDFVTFDAPPELSLGNIVIRDPLGYEIPFKGFINIPWQPHKEDFIYLEPNDSITKSVYILDSEKYTEPGNYVLFAKYQNSFDPKDVFKNSTDKRVAWKGTITSESVQFELMP